MKRMLATWALIFAACDEPPPPSETPPDADVSPPPDATEIIDIVEIDAQPVIRADAGPCGECDFPGYCLDGMCHDAIWMRNAIGESIALKVDGTADYQSGGAGAFLYRRNPTSTTPVELPIATEGSCNLTVYYVDGPTDYPYEEFRAEAGVLTFTGGVIDPITCNLSPFALDTVYVSDLPDAYQNVMTFGQRITAQATGGADFDAFELAAFVPRTPSMLTDTVTRGAPLPINWGDGGDPGDPPVHLYVATWDPVARVSIQIHCQAEDTGAFVVPPSLTSLLSPDTTWNVLGAQRVSEASLTQWSTDVPPVLQVIELQVWQQIERRGTFVP